MNALITRLIILFLYIAPAVFLFKTTDIWGPFGLVLAAGVTGFVAAFSKMLNIRGVSRVLICEIAFLWLLGKIGNMWPIKVLTISILLFLVCRFFALLQFSPSHYRILRSTSD